MPIIPNASLARLRAGQVSLGFGVHHLRTAATPALAKAAGYDWLFIDMEHGAFSVQEATQLCLAALPVGDDPVSAAVMADPDPAIGVADGPRGDKEEGGIVGIHEDVVQDQVVGGAEFGEPMPGSAPIERVVEPTGGGAHIQVIGLARHRGKRAGVPTGRTHCAPGSLSRETLNREHQQKPEEGL